MKTKLLLSSIMVFTAISLSFSQLQTDTVHVKLTGIDVIAERNKIFSDMGRIVTVINKKDIQLLSINSIDELLESIPGIDIRNRGISGTQADISMRGGSFDQVLVLLNGVNITDPQTGHYNLDIPLDLADVMRVEVLQGSSARIYGPNAFSGAINIVTEKNTKRELAGQLTGGSYNSFGQSLTGAIGSGKLQSFISLSHKGSEGYRENTDFEIYNVFSQTIIRTEKAGKFDFQASYQQKAYGANGFYSLAYPNQFDFTRTIFSALNWTLSKGIFTYNIQAYHRQHHDRFELFRNFENAASWYTSHNYHLTDVTGAKATLSSSTSIGKFTIGIDERNEHIYSTVLGEKLSNNVKVPFEKNIAFTKSDNRLISTGFFDYSKNLNNWHLSIGTAITHTADYKTNTVGGFDLGYAVSPDLRLFIAANSAVRLPTFTDLYYKSTIQNANPNLKPEHSKTFEIGGQYNVQNIRFNLTSFYRMGSNIIDWIKYPDSTKWISQNLTQVNAFGIDFNAEYTFHNSIIEKLKYSYSFLNMDKSATGFDSKYALDYLKHKAVISLQHRLFSHLVATWKATYYERSGNYSLSSSAPLQTFSPYLLLDTRFVWTIKKQEIFVDVNNILNSDYVDFGGLTQPGINFNGGLRFKIN